MCCLNNLTLPGSEKFRTLLNFPILSAMRKFADKVKQMQSKLLIIFVSANFEKFPIAIEFFFAFLLLL